MRKLLTLLALVLATGIGFATTASASPTTCTHFQDPTVELVWSHACHF